MRTTAEVVIVGGGGIGTSIAYHLALRGCRGVVLLEREALGSGSTEKSIGGIRQQFSTEANVLMARYNVEAFRRFSQEMGVDLRFHQDGYLLLSGNPKVPEAFARNAETQRRLGVRDVEILSPAQVKRRFPYLNTDDLLVASFCGTDGYADPHTVVQGYARRARQLGAEIQEGVEVVGIEVQGGKVRGVKTTGGNLEAPVVVNAAGPWAASVALMAGIDIPVSPLKLQVFVTDPFSGIPEVAPLVLDLDTGFFFRREGPGLLLGLDEVETEDRFSVEAEGSRLDRVVEAAMHRCPPLAEAGVQSAWTGLCEMTPDSNAILGRVPEVQGLLLANGFSGHGFQMCPSVGLLMAETILDGEARTIDISQFSLERFRTGRLLWESLVG